MKVKYIGKSFGIESLTNNKIYDVIAIENDMIRIIDDSGEDYLYSAAKPSALNNPNEFGKWEVIEDNEKLELSKIIK